MTALVAVVLIGAAVAMGLVQLLLPLAVHYPDFIANQLAGRLHRPVRFASITSTWQPSGPLLTVRDLTLGAGHPGGESITLPHAAVKFDFGAWLRPAHRWITLRLNDMNLRVEHSSTGWDVAGFGAPGGESRASLQSLPVNLDLRNLRVDVVDDVTGRAWHLSAPHLQVVNVGDSVRFGGEVRQMHTTQAVAIRGSADTSARDYDLYLTSRDLDLASSVRGLDLDGYSIRGGVGSFELWGHWRDGKPAAAAARYALHKLVIVGPDGRTADVASLAGAFDATKVADGWNLAWRGPGTANATIDTAGGVLLQLRGQPGAWRVSAAARAVDLAPWLSLLAVTRPAPKALAGWVAHAQPQVMVDSAALTWHEGGPYDATVRFSGLHAAASGTIPGIALSHATVRADPQALVLEIPPQAMTLALTDVFRKPFPFTRFGATFAAWREDGQWNIAADALQFDLDGLVGNGRAHLVWPGDGQRPFLSAYAALERGTVRDATLFWPYRSMPPTLMAWLDHALVAGDITAGSVLVRGNLADWPFLHNEGRFEATGTLADGTFDFSEQWPRATGVDAKLDFVDNHMDIVATRAIVQGVTATHAVASIPDLNHGVLGLDVEGSGTGAQLLDFVRHSPVGADAIGVLQGMTVGGTGKFAVNLSIPLDDAANFSLAGRVELARADVTARKWNLALKNLGGPLVIEGKGFRADGLTAMFRGAPATLSLAVGSGVNDPKDIVEAALDATVSAQTLVQGYPDLAGLVAHASGAAPFHVGVKVVAGTGKAPAVPILGVQSSLVGIALDFPAPLRKPAATPMPLDLTLQLPPDGAPLQVSLGDVLQVRGTLADAARARPAALAINFGRVPPAAAPATGLDVGGYAATLDLSGWIQQALGGGSGPAMPPLTRAGLSIGNAEVFGTSLGAMQFGFASGTQDDTISVSGAAMKGTLQVPAGNLMVDGITARFDRLYWPAPPAPESSAPPAPPPLTSPIAPAAVPPLHVTIGDLRLGDAQLGATVFESEPTVSGMHVSRFESKGADFTIAAHGDWDGTRTVSQSHFVTAITSNDFGDALAEFGFKGMLAGGRDSHLHIDGTWPGAPSGFSLAWMDGTLSIKIGEGSIVAVKPGLGRLLGLLSLRELPSRFLLHFGDVFKSGFGFDHASATFRLQDGSAYTRDMVIAAPAAQIAMQGRAGFRDHDFDLTVAVTPHVGGTLPVVGAVVGGPVGAAAGLVMQGLLGKGINKAAGSVYRVTGSWDKPTITTLASLPAPGTGPALPAPAASGAGSPTAVPAGAVPRAAAVPARAASTGGD